MKPFEVGTPPPNEEQPEDRKAVHTQKVGHPRPYLMRQYQRPQGNEAMA